MKNEPILEKYHFVWAVTDWGESISELSVNMIEAVSYLCRIVGSLYAHFIQIRTRLKHTQIKSRKSLKINAVIPGAGRGLAGQCGDKFYTQWHDQFLHRFHMLSYHLIRTMILQTVFTTCTDSVYKWANWFHTFRKYKYSHIKNISIITVLYFSEKFAVACPKQPTSSVKRYKKMGSLIV